MQEHCKLIILHKISIFFKPPFSYLLHEVVCLFFVLIPSQLNSSCIFFSSLVISVATLVTRERCISLDIAKILKIVIYHYTVKSRILHNFINFFTFQTCLVQTTFYILLHRLKETKPSVSSVFKKIM